MTVAKKDMTGAAMEGKALLEYLDNDPQLLREVIGVFLADCPQRIAELRTAVMARNLVQIVSASHALRGSVGTFGAKKAIEAARELESIGRQEKLKGIEEAFSALERELALVASSLEKIAKDSD
jgi:HPt (histidine-containing phosphotransfer) domain-containing protein